MAVLRLELVVAGSYHEEKEHHCEHKHVKLHLHGLLFNEVRFPSFWLFCDLIYRKKDEVNVLFCH